MCEFMNQIFINIIVYRLLFFSFVKNPTSILVFFIFMFINSVCFTFYILLLNCFVIYWLFKLLCYYFFSKNELKPYFWDCRGSIIKLFLFSEIVLKAYLISFFILYKFLYLYFNKKQTNRLQLFLTCMLNVIVRVVIGFPKFIIYNSFIWSVKFYSIEQLKDGKDELYYNIISQNMSDYIILIPLI